MAQVSQNISFWSNTVLHQIILFSIAFLLYANTLSHEFTQDDAIVIYDNMFTTQGIEGVPGILKNDTFFGFFKKEGKAKLVSGGRYRPLTQLMFALEWELFGDNPFVGHLLNIILFGLLVLILYRFVNLLLLQKYESGFAIKIAFIAGLIFALHPVHTEVVANIKGRDEIMTLIFSLLTAIFVLKAIDKEKALSFLLAGLMFFLALMSKENAITFVAIIPLMIFLFRSVKMKKYIYTISALLAATIVFLIIRSSILGMDFGSKSMELMNNPFLKIENGRYVAFSFGEQMATILFTLGKYVQLLFFPHPLTHDYYPRQIEIMAFMDWQVIFSFLVYGLLTVVAIIKFKKHRILSFGILFYLLSLSIVSNVVFPIGTNMSERFLFMPSVGFAIVIAWSMTKYLQKHKMIINVVLILIAVLFSIKTFTRNFVWKNDFTLFTTDVHTSTNSAKVLNAAGGTLVDHAAKEENKTKKEKMLREALGYLERAVIIHPNYKNPYLIKGNAQFYLKEYPKAIETYKKLLKLVPNYPEAKKNLGVSYREAGKYYGQEKNDLPRALENLKLAYEILPEDYETIRLYGIAHGIAKNYKQALVLFEKCVQMKPDNAGAYLNLGNVYYNIGDEENGRINHAKALKLNPEIFKNK